MVLLFAVLRQFYFGSIVNYMEREGRGENFVKRNRLNIVARSVAAISIAAAGAAAVEKFGSFDLLPNPVDSANHLVLNNLHESYEQLIDKLPEVEKAEAAEAPKTCNWVVLLTLYHCVVTQQPAAKIRVVATDHIAINTPTLEEFLGIPYWQDHICHANVTDVNLNSIDATVVVDAENDHCDTFGPYPVNVNICASNVGWPAGTESGEIAGSGSCSSGVGGIAALPEVRELPQNMTSEKSKDYTNPIAVGIAGAVAAITATGAVLYTRRNRSAK